MTDGHEDEPSSDEVGERELCSVESVEIEGIGVTVTSEYDGTVGLVSEVDGERKGTCSDRDHDEGRLVAICSGRSGAWTP